MILAFRRLDVAALRFFSFLAAVFVLLLSLVAHADVLPVPPAAPGAPTGPAWVTALIQYCLVPLIPVLGTLVAAVLTKLALFLHTKDGNSKVASALAVATDFVTTAFSHLRAGIEPDLKMALADGTLDAVERANLVTKLVSLVKAELPAGLMGVLSATLGPALETWLQGKAGQVIQAAVAEAPTGVAAVLAPLTLHQAAGLPSPK